MALFIFLTVVQALVAALLVIVILMQRSEGGGLGAGAGSNSFMSARGAADFLSRATAGLALVFVVLSIVLAAMAVRYSSGRTIDTSLVRPVPAAPDPLANAGAPSAAALAPASVPTAPASSADPLAGAAKQ